VFSHADEQPARRRYTTDNWNGYFAARQRVLDGLQRTAYAIPWCCRETSIPSSRGISRATRTARQPAAGHRDCRHVRVIRWPATAAARRLAARESDLLLAEGRYRGHVALRLSPAASAGQPDGAGEPG
jgi:hypothetical protein